MALVSAGDRLWQAGRPGSVDSACPWTGPFRLLRASSTPFRNVPQASSWRPVTWARFSPKGCCFLLFCCCFEAIVAGAVSWFPLSDALLAHGKAARLHVDSATAAVAERVCRLRGPSVELCGPSGGVTASARGDNVTSSFPVLFSCLTSLARPFDAVLDRMVDVVPLSCSRSWRPRFQLLPTARGLALGLRR